MKKKFNLRAKVTAFVYTTVEANSEEEAIILAENRGFLKPGISDENMVNSAWVGHSFCGEVFDVLAIEHE